MSRRYKRGYKRKRYGSSSYSIAKKALSKVRKLEKKQEVKFISMPLTTIAAVPIAGDVRSISSIAQGDLVSTRDGDKISPFFFSLRYHWSGTAAAVDGVYRTIIFVDKRQVVSTIPTVAAVLEQTSPFSQYNGQNRGRFKILYDQVFTGTNDVALQQNFTGVISRKMSGNMMYTGAAATSWTQNGLFMINITNLAANQPAFLFTFRLYFNDP